MRNSRPTAAPFLVCLFLMLAALGGARLWCWSIENSPPPVVVVVPTTSIQQALKAARVMDGEQGLGSCSPIAVVGGRIVWLTCHHVVDDVVPSVVKLRNGDTLPVLGVATHPSADAAVLWTTSNPALPIEPIEVGDMARIGTDILTAGYPRRIHCLYLSRGVIGGKDEDDQLWTSAPIYFGCSGGPVLADGKLVGLNHGLYRDLRTGDLIVTMSTIVPIESFRDWLKEQTACAANVK
jgi:S1-C subfamily serine protease